MGGNREIGVRGLGGGVGCWGLLGAADLVSCSGCGWSTRDVLYVRSTAQQYWSAGRALQVHLIAGRGGGPGGMRRHRAAIEIRPGSWRFSGWRCDRGGRRKEEEKKKKKKKKKKENTEKKQTRRKIGSSHLRV